MAEDTTRELLGGSFEERVLAEFAALNARLTTLEARLTTLEEKVDRRLQETRPIWENVQTEVRRMNVKFDNVIRELFEMRTDLTLLDRRVTQIEGTRPE